MDANSVLHRAWNRSELTRRVICHRMRLLFGIQDCTTYYPVSLKMVSGHRLRGTYPNVWKGSFSARRNSVA